MLEGSVRKAGERLRVTGQLIDATSGNHIWAERYDRPVADIFAVQDEITANVVAAIEPQLYAAENLRLQSKPPESLDAWGCVVRAMPYIWTWVSQNDDTGVNLLNRAIELDPGYARARSLASVGLRHACRPWQYGLRARDLRGLVLAQRAIDLDPDDPWAHLAAGYVYTVLATIWAGGRGAERGVATQSELCASRGSFLAAAYGYAGLAEEGYRQLEIATRLSPRDYAQAANLSIEGLCHLVAGRYADAVTAERRAVQLRPEFWHGLAHAHRSRGPRRRPGARATRPRRCKRLQPNVSIAWIEKYYPLIRVEDRARYIEGLRRAGLE